MPSGPTESLLRLLGVKLPELPRNPTEEERRIFENYAQQEDIKRPLWKKLMSKLAVDIPAGAVQGMLGIEPRNVRDPKQDISDWANFISQAGLPFAAYAAKGIPKVFHGTPYRFEKFDPSKYDKDDVLGWMTHFAEDPKYAEEYAVGAVKHGIDWEGISPQRIIPAKPEAKNVLDLIDPNPDDISQVLASLDPNERKLLINRFKNVRKDFRENPNFYVSKYIKPTHMKSIEEDLGPSLLKNPATTVLVESLRLTPEQFASTPFDAIRYRDAGHKSWAIPEGTPIRSAYSPAELIDVPKEIKVLRSERSGGGVLRKTTPTYQSLPLHENDPRIVVFNVKGDPNPNLFDNLDEALDFLDTKGIDSSNLDYLPINKYEKMMSMKAAGTSKPTKPLAPNFSPESIFEKWSNAAINEKEAEKLFTDWFNYVKPKDFPKTWEKYKKHMYWSDWMK